MPKRVTSPVQLVLLALAVIAAGGSCEGIDDEPSGEIPSGFDNRRTGKRRGA